MISGDKSAWTLNQDLEVGRFGKGALTVKDGGAVSVGLDDERR